MSDGGERSGDQPSTDNERSTGQACARPRQDWSEQRKARASEFLLPRTTRWIATLPVDFQLTATAKAFPRIANELAALWSEQEELTDYLDELLVDRRGRRQGFPARVLSELHALRAYCATFVAARDTAPSRRSPGGLAA